MIIIISIMFYIGYNLKKGKISGNILTKFVKIFIEIFFYVLYLPFMEV